jgi:hypothetical protein
LAFSTVSVLYKADQSRPKAAAKAARQSCFLRDREGRKKQSMPKREKATANAPAAAVPGRKAEQNTAAEKETDAIASVLITELLKT